MEGEALSYGRGEEETTHSVCTRQLMDECESVKMQQTSTEEVKGVPFDDQLNVEGGWRSRESKSVVGLRKKTQSVSKAGR